MDKLNQLKEIDYYEKINLNINKKYHLLTKNNKLELKDIYLVKEKTKEKGIFKYEIYSKDSKNLIASFNKDGKIQFSKKSMNKYLEKEKLDKILLQNKENYRGKLEFDKVKEEKNNVEEEKIIKKDINNPKKTKIHKMEKDLGLDMNDIQSCTKVKLDGDINIFRDRVKEARDFDMVQLVYLKKEKTFRFVGKKVGEPAKFFDSIEPAKATIKKSINVLDNGEKVEERNIKGLMKLNSDKNYDFAINIGKYGIIELNALRKDPVTNRYMATQIETTSQKPTSRQVKEMMDKNKNVDISEEISKYDDQVEKGDKNIDLYEISDENKKGEVVENNQKINEEHKDENVKRNDEKENWGPWESMKPKKYNE